MPAVRRLPAATGGYEAVPSRARGAGAGHPDASTPLSRNPSFAQVKPEHCTMG